MPPPDPTVPPVPTMDHTGGYKDSQYTYAMGTVILQRIAAGETVRQIAADPAMPSYATIFHWRKLHPDFARDWEAVRMLQAFARVERWASRPARTRPGGKKSSFTVEMGEAVCGLVREGVTMARINATPGMPSAKVVYTWLKREPVFRKMVADARAEADRGFRIEGEMAGDRLVCFPMDRQAFAAIKRVWAHYEGRAGAFRPKVYGRFRP